MRCLQSFYLGSDSSKPVCVSVQPVPHEQLQIDLTKDVKACYSCRRTLPIECFSLNRPRVDAVEQYRNRRCNQCRAQREKGSPAVRAKLALVEEMKARPCADCGRTFPKVCMDFDHVRGEKKYTIGTAYRWLPMEKLKAEIEKCDVVCACCHRIRTESRPHQRPGRPHVFLAEVQGESKEVRVYFSRAAESSGSA